MIRIIWYTADIQTTGCWRQYVSYVTVLSVSGMSILAYLITVSEWGRLVVIKHEWMERSLSVTLLYTSGLVWWSQSRRLLRRRVWPDRRRSYPLRKPLHFTRTAHHEIAHRIRHTTVLYLQLQLALTGSNPTSAYVRRRLWHRLGHRRSIAHWYFALKSSASIRRLSIR